MNQYQSSVSQKIRCHSPSDQGYAELECNLDGES